MVGGKKVRTIIKTVQNALSESKPRNRECYRPGAYHLETKQSKTKHQLNIIGYELDI